MNALTRDRGRDSYASDDVSDRDAFQLTRRQHRAAFPVRSQASQSTGRKRSRGGVSARLKARSFNGAHRRRRATWLIWKTASTATSPWPIPTDRSEPS